MFREKELGSMMLLVSVQGKKSIIQKGSLMQTFEPAAFISAIFWLTHIKTI